MNTIKIILTGATGMAGEGVLIECLQNPKISNVLVVGRKSSGMNHPKLKELLVPSFFELDKIKNDLKGYDACFFCAGISSVGMKEAEYTKTTYDTTLYFAQTILALNPDIVFNFITGQSTDSTEKSKMMWARVKGKTENDLMKLFGRNEYNFRPGFMAPFKEQKNVKSIFKPIIFLYPKLFPKSSLTLQDLGQAMIATAMNGTNKQVLEIADIKALVG